MAFISWQKADDGQLFFMRFDATMSDGHLSQVNIPEHAVETGENITDHVRANSDTVNLEIQISNTPVFYYGNIAESLYPTEIGQESHAMPMQEESVELPVTEPPIRIFTGIVPIDLPFPTRKPIRVSVKKVQNYIDRVAAVYNELVTLMKTGQVCNLHTSLRRYENMLLTSVDTTRNANRGNAADINLSMKSIRIADTELVPLPKEKRGRRKKPDQKPTKEADAEQSKKSLYRQLTDTVDLSVF